MRRWLGAAFALLAILAVLDIETRILSPCTINQAESNGAATEDGPPKSCAALGVVLWRIAAPSIIDAKIFIGADINEISAGLTALATVFIAAFTFTLYRATTGMLRVTERTLTDLERPYIFVYELSELKRGDFNSVILTYSVGNYGKSAAIVESVREQMWYGDPTVMYDTDEDRAESGDHPLLITRVLSPDFAKDGIEFLVPTDRIYVRGESDGGLYIGPRKYETGNLFYRIIVDYRGAFTRGHSSSYCWRYDFGYCRFLLESDGKVTYSH
jgi:hypothetical protein